MERFSEDLASKPALIALTKIDLLPDFAAVAEKLAESGLEVFAVSAATNNGLEPLLYQLAKLLEEYPLPPVVTVLEPKPESDGKLQYLVEKTGEEYAVKGDALVRMVAMTNLDNTEAIRYLHRKLKGSGILQALKNAGAEEGDTVRIGQFAFTYLEED